MSPVTFTAKSVQHEIKDGRVIAVIRRTYESHRPATPEQQAEQMAIAIVMYDPTHPDSPGDQLKFTGPVPASECGTDKGLMPCAPDDDDWWAQVRSFK